MTISSSKPYFDDFKSDWASWRFARMWNFVYAFQKEKDSLILGSLDNHKITYRNLFRVRPVQFVVLRFVREALSNISTGFVASLVWLVVVVDIQFLHSFIVL